MTNKPMLSVERELLELVTDNKHIDKESISIRRWEALCKLRAILSKPAAQHQGEPEIPRHANCVTVLILQYGEQNYSEAIYCADGKFRFGYDEDAITDVEKWMPLPSRSQQGEPVAEVKVVEGDSPHVHLYQDVRDGTKLYAEQPAPVADHTQCEECKGWGYHENHHEGGGTECGECGGSGNAIVAEVMAMPDRMKVEPFTTIDRGSKNYKAGYNAAIAEVAKLNGLKT